MKIFFSIILIIALFFSCSSPTEWDPGKFVWSADTLDDPTVPGAQTLMSALWGDTPDFLLTGGFQSGGFHDYMYKFENGVWDNAGLHAIHGGPVEGNIDIDDIWGSSQNDVWAVGRYSFPYPIPDSSLIVHYNGSAWQEAIYPTKSALKCLGGEYPDYFWAGGADYTLLRLSGNQWVSEPLPRVHDPDRELIGTYPMVRFIAGNRNDGYLLVIMVWYEDHGKYNYFLTRENEQWVVKDSVQSSVSDLWMSPTGSFLYATGNGLYEWKGPGEHEKLLPETVAWVYGTADNNIFAADNNVSGGSVLYHFNGSSWKQIITGYENNSVFRDIWSDGREVFVLAHVFEPNNMYSLVIHGK